MGKLCAGVQIHVEDAQLRSRRVPPVARGGAGVQGAAPAAAGLRLWRDFAYEYERDRLAIDVINGSELLREWVDDPAATPADLDALTVPDEKAWADERRTRDAVLGNPAFGSDAGANARHDETLME